MNDGVEMRVVVYVQVKIVPTKTSLPALLLTLQCSAQIHHALALQLHSQTQYDVLAFRQYNTNAYRTPLTGSGFIFTPIVFYSSFLVTGLFYVCMKSIMEATIKN